MKASVIICTYNRSVLLKESIRSIQKLDFPSEQYEIVVVDNNSSDNTKNVVMELAGGSKVKIKYIFEKAQGLSHARNAGINGSEGEIVAFTDDDIEAEPQWLMELVSAFDDPEAAGAGGPIRPVWLADRPDWLTGRWLNYYAVSEFSAARETGKFRYPDCPWGANIAFRRGVFEAVGLFPTDLGRKASCLLSNEEINLCRKIEERGKLIKFAPGAVIHHKLSPKRIKKQWLYHRTYWQGRSDAVLFRNTDMKIYSELRTHASALLRREVEKRENEFDVKCGGRAARGYIHQLLFSDSGSVNNFRGVRALETFIGELIKTAGRLVADRENKITVLKNAVEARDREIRDTILALGESDTQLNVLRKLDERLKRMEESIKTFGQFKQYEEQLREKDQLIKNKDAALKQCEDQLRQKREEIIEVESQLKEKCLEVVTRDQELMRACEERSYERQRLETALRQSGEKMEHYEKAISDFRRLLQERERLEIQIAVRNKSIEEIRSSMSWKITAPLRTLYGILRRRGK